MTTVFDAYRDVVRPEWIDNNNHMNMGFYLVVFDEATGAFLEAMGLTPEHRREHAITTFCLEGHINYLAEVRSGDPLRFTTRLLGFDDKRIHYFHEMRHGVDNYLAATNELMSLHLSEKTRRAAPMHDAVLARLSETLAAHRQQPMPAQVGRVMGLAAGAAKPND